MDITTMALIAGVLIAGGAMAVWTLRLARGQGKAMEELASEDAELCRRLGLPTPQKEHAEHAMALFIAASDQVTFRVVYNTLGRGARRVKVVEMPGDHDRTDEWPGVLHRAVQAGR